MLLFFNKFKLYIGNIKILIVLSNFNTNLSIILINNIYIMLCNFGIYSYNIIIFFISGSLEFNIILNKIFEKFFFDIYIILGLILKNKTFHFEIISFNINFFIFNLSFNLNFPIINFLIISNNRFIIFSKLLKINNLNLKIFYKFLNLLYYLKYNF